MANELVFRAADTATALEKVQDNLGENAYIIEIKNVENFVEITASLQEPKKVKGASQIASKNSVLVLSKMLQHDAGLNPSMDKTNLDDLTNSDSFVSTAKIPSNTSDKHVAEANAEIGNFGEEMSPYSEALEDGQPIGDDNNLVNVYEANASQSQNNRTEIEQKKVYDDVNAPEISEELKISGSNDGLLSFGDLLNIGLTSEFIKNEFSISEFSGSVTKAHLVDALIKSFWDSSSCRTLDVYYNIVLLGTPGAGKSTICAKLMQYFSLFGKENPRILEVSPDQLFEVDRLSYFTRLFNFELDKKQKLEPEIIFGAEKQITEISWDYYFDFLEALETHNKHLSHIKLFLVLPASMNVETLSEIFKVSRGLNSIILNKCDYGRVSVKHLMLLYQNNCKIVSLSGEREAHYPIEFADENIMREFIDYVLRGSL